LRKLVGERSSLEGEGETVRALIANVDDSYPGFSPSILEDGELRRFVNVYVKGEDIRFLEGLETAVPSGAEVSIIPAVAGGANASGGSDRASTQYHDDLVGRLRSLEIHPHVAITRPAVASEAAHAIERLVERCDDLQRELNGA
jgi:molybdopterin converting factor small subunit